MASIASDYEIEEKTNAERDWVINRCKKRQVSGLGSRVSVHFARPANENHIGRELWLSNGIDESKIDYMGTQLY